MHLTLPALLTLLTLTTAQTTITGDFVVSDGITLTGSAASSAAAAISSDISSMDLSFSLSFSSEFASLSDSFATATQSGNAGIITDASGGASLRSSIQASASDLRSSLQASASEERSSIQSDVVGATSAAASAAETGNSDSGAIGGKNAKEVMVGGLGAGVLVVAALV